jgi:hypothetical protein
MVKRDGGIFHTFLFTEEVPCIEKYLNFMREEEALKVQVRLEPTPVEFELGSVEAGEVAA